MLGRRETLRAHSRRAVTLRPCTSLGSRRRAGRRCLEGAPPARAPSATVSPAAERTKWCKRVCLETRSGPGPRLAQRAKRSEEHTSELQSQSNLVCRLLLEKKKKKNTYRRI